MKHRYAEIMLGIIVVAAAVKPFAACGGEARKPSASAGGACGAAPIPKQHRPNAAACPTARGTVPLPDMTACTIRTYITCTKDADCTAGKNGRCFAKDACNTACSYDECLTDSDCAAGPCLCRSSNTDSQRNECLPGSNCKIDSDCNGGCGYCSPSATPDPAGCTIGTLTYNCHTANDECVDQNDCVGLLFEVPLPSSPSSPKPQHSTVPFARSA